MKKRMLITTIVMMLVLAVALTTSSLAWFSASQATVTANNGTFTAKTAGSAANIGVASALDATNWKSSADMTVTGSNALVPLCAIAALPQNLTADLEKAKTLADIADAELLNGANFLNDGSVQWFPLNTGNELYKKALSSQANSVIFAKNLDNNGTNVTTLKVTLTITSDTVNAAAPNFYIVLSTGDGTSVLRTAVISKVNGYVAFDFSSASSSESNPLLLSAVDSDANRQTADIVSIENTQNASQSVTFTNLEWTPGTVYAVHVYAWYEGETLDVTTDGCTHEYKLDLEAGIPTV